MKASALMTCASMIAALTCAAAAQTDPPAAVASSSNSFAVGMVQRLAAGQEKNLFFSPSSIHTALAMTYIGARGKTAEQMARVLEFPVLPDQPISKMMPAGERVRIEAKHWSQQQVSERYRNLLDKLKPGKNAAYQLSAANALWGQKGFPWQADFLKTAKDEFGAPLREVDYQTAAEAARKQINDWVEQQTRDKIKDLIAPGVLKSTTRLVLANAIYFKGTWARPFGKKATQDMNFRTGGKTVQAPMMFQKSRFGYAADDNVQVLSMPYKGNDLSMLIVLPKKDDGLKTVVADLTAEKLQGWQDALQSQEVLTYVPRFKMTSEFGLAPTLAAMGMKDAFDAGAADFSGMDGRRDLFISAVVHKAFVDVNEEGTEAAAATGIMVGVTSVQIDQPTTFKADHPFLFAIRHNATGALLFLGQVVEPK